MEIPGLNAVIELPYRALDPLPPSDFRRVFLAALLEDQKWDPQVGDTSALANFALALHPAAWQEISQQAERLAVEVLAAEAELLGRPELHKELGLAGEVRRQWRRPEQVQVINPGDARIIRFDFHYTPDGWRISEANIDTPGGWIEASAFTARMLAHYPGMQLAGDPVEALAQAIRERLAAGDLVALIHCTAYTEDRAMLMCLQKRLDAAGLKGCLVSPDQLRWKDGQANFATSWEQGRAAYLVRFYPAEWLPGLPRSCGWPHYFKNCRIPSSNPTSSLLAQTKRFPLAWERLSTPLPTWRRLLPPVYDPRRIRDDAQTKWVLKPVLGRAGGGVTIKGLAPEKKWRQQYRLARREGGYWIAQERFEILPVSCGQTDWYPCIGVYTVAGRAAGIYARISTTPITDENAKEVAVFIGK